MNREEILVELNEDPLAIEIENSDVVIRREENVIESISVNGIEQEVDENKNVDISVPTKLSDLINDNNTVQDENYIHTDNNYSNEDKDKLDSLENYDDTEIKEDISNIQSEQTTQNNNITALDNNKVDKIEGKSLSTNDYSNEDKLKLDSLQNYDDTEIKEDISDLADVVEELYTTKADRTELPTKTSDLTNDNGFIDKNVNNLTNYTLKTNTGSLIDLEINQSTYVVTLRLKDVDGNIISTDTIDLPLESVVIGGSFDSVNKKIVLTLENGNTVDIPVGDLVAGLQTEITSSNKLASDLVDDTNSGNKFTNTSEKQTWNAKYDKPSGGIPKTDLASDVQVSLGKADTALQEHQSLTDYVKNTDYATSSIGGVIKIAPYRATEIYNQGYLSCITKTYSQYQDNSLTGTSAFISKGTLENVITGKELVNKTYVDNIVGNIESILEELDIGGGI